MRNNEYREMLVAKKEKERDDWMVGHYDRLLQEYDRLHPELSGVKTVQINEKQNVRQSVSAFLPDGLVYVYDNVSGCNITAIDGTLNVTIE